MIKGSLKSEKNKFWIWASLFLFLTSFTAFARPCQNMLLGGRLSPSKYWEYKTEISKSSDIKVSLEEFIGRSKKADVHEYLAWISTLVPSHELSIETLLLKKKRQRLTFGFAFGKGLGRKTIREKDFKARMVIRMLDYLNAAHQAGEVKDWNWFGKKIFPSLYVRAQLEHDRDFNLAIDALRKRFDELGIEYSLDPHKVSESPRRAAVHRLHWTIERAFTLLMWYFVWDQLEGLYDMKQAIDQMEELTDESEKRTQKIERVNQEFDKGGLERLQKLVEEEP